MKLRPIIWMAVLVLLAGLTATLRFVLNARPDTPISTPVASRPPAHPAAPTNSEAPPQAPSLDRTPIPFLPPDVDDDEWDPLDPDPLEIRKIGNGLNWSSAQPPNKTAVPPKPNPGTDPAETGHAVYRYGHLPKGLPGWFTELDVDQDGQIDLFEWRRSQAPEALFHRLDLNDDGLITPEELLRVLAHTPAAELQAAASPPHNPSTGAAVLPPGGR